MIFESSRQYHLDFPLTAIVTLGIFLLLSCDGFKHSGWAVLCGLSFGIGMLIKGQLLFFVIPVLIAVVITSLLFDKLNSRGLVVRKILNLSLFIIISGGIAVFWWADKMPWVRGQFLEHLGHPEHMYYSQAGMESYSVYAFFGILKQ